MRLLLDSHAFLWWMAGDERLSADAASALTNSDADIALSAATVWELSIKHALGKLSLLPSVEHALIEAPRRRGVSLLPIHPRHATRAAALPLHHRDPFDRMLIAQASAEGRTFVSADPHVARYDVPILW